MAHQRRLALALLFALLLLLLLPLLWGLLFRLLLLLLLRAALLSLGTTSSVSGLPVNAWCSCWATLHLAARGRWRRRVHGLGPSYASVGSFRVGHQREAGRAGTARPAGFGTRHACWRCGACCCNWLRIGGLQIHIRWCWAACTGPPLACMRGRGTDEQRSAGAQ